MTEGKASELCAAVLLELHHERLDDLLEDVKLMADAGSWKDAGRRFAAFRREMHEHMRLEEEMMFPAFEGDASTPRGPTRVMRDEHAAINALLTDVERGLAEGGPISRTISELEARLGAHNFKEERVLYPTFERTAPVAVRTALAAQVEALVRDGR
jgi:iron-sulfur cluster repair protein YtfE (RIC family)